MIPVLCEWLFSVQISWKHFLSILLQNNLTFSSGESFIKWVENQDIVVYLLLIIHPSHGGMLNGEVTTALVVSYQYYFFSPSLMHLPPCIPSSWRSSLCRIKHWFSPIVAFSTTIFHSGEFGRAIFYGASFTEGRDVPTWFPGQVVQQERRPRLCFHYQSTNATLTNWLNSLL